MKSNTLFSKTAKGVTELNQRKLGLSKNLYAVLGAIDGKSGIDDLAQKFPGLTNALVSSAIADLVDLGLIRELANDLNSGLHTSDGIEVSELDPEEGVRAWAEARRCAKALSDTGFYATATHIRKPGGQYTALIIEDNQSVADLEVILLEGEGFVAHHAASGKQAAELLQSVEPDLFILDVNLGDTSGFKILASLRKSERFKDVPIIMVTGQIGEEDVLAGIRGEADGYIFKPFQPDTLLKCVRQVLGREIAN